MASPATPTPSETKEPFTPIIQQGPGISQPNIEATQTLQDVIQCASLLLRGVLNPIDGATAPTDLLLLTQFANSIHLDLLRHSRWAFLLSSPMTFLTTPTVANSGILNNSYWLGAGEQNPNLTIDTTLNLLSIDVIKRDTVIDRTHQRRLANTELQPISEAFLQPGNPRLYEVLSNAPSVITLWPPPKDALFIEFRYYNRRNNLQELSDVVQIPDRYKDIVCHGVTWLAYQYVKDTESAGFYQQLYMAGKGQMIKDANLFPRGEEFIRPDPAGIASQSISGLGLDSGIESSLP